MQGMSSYPKLAIREHWPGKSNATNDDRSPREGLAPVSPSTFATFHRVDTFDARELQTIRGLQDLLRCCDVAVKT